VFGECLSFYALTTDFVQQLVTRYFEKAMEIDNTKWKCSHLDKFPVVHILVYLDCVGCHRCHFVIMSGAIPIHYPTVGVSVSQMSTSLKCPLCAADVS